MIAYNYHPDLYFFIDEIECQESPLEPGVPLVPAHATVLAPPTDYEEGYKPIFDETYRVWEIRECHYGETVWEKATGTPYTITGLAAADSTVYTTIEPPVEEGKTCVWNTETDSWDLVEDHRFEKVWYKSNGALTCVVKPGPIPDDKTNVEPPAITSGQGLHWNAASSSWEIKENRIGTSIWEKATGTLSVVTELGEIPEGFTDLECPDYGIWDSSTNAWKVDLDKAKNASYDRINAKAEALCNAVVTPGSNQMARYQRKEEFAREFITRTIPTDAVELASFKEEFAIIYGEVGTTADTPTGVANAIIAMADAWWAYGDRVETLRVVSKKQVGLATSVSEILQIENNIAWPTL